MPTHIISVTNFILLPSTYVVIISNELIKVKTDDEIIL